MEALGIRAPATMTALLIPFGPPPPLLSDGR
jgi:hypothetical protein